VALVKELHSETLVLGRAHKFTVVVVNIEVLASIDQSEVLHALHDGVDAVFNVKDLG
jgi:coenzyme F420-reducing hydrogenase delta subunit